jgi:hypothetical protein
LRLIVSGIDPDQRLASLYLLVISDKDLSNVAIDFGCNSDRIDLDVRIIRFLSVLPNRLMVHEPNHHGDYNDDCDQQQNNLRAAAELFLRFFIVVASDVLLIVGGFKRALFARILVGPVVRG